MRFAVVVAARSGSRRLPGKALLPMQGMPMLRFLLKRLRPSAQAQRFVLATTRLPQDDALAELARQEGWEVCRGAENDLVERYLQAARQLDLDHLVRVTGDCPFTGHETLDYCLELCRALAPFDLASTKGLFPMGIDYEVFSAQALQRLHEEEPLKADDREHLTKYFYDHPQRYRLAQLAPPQRWADRRWHFTVDYPEDYQFCAGLAARFPDPGFGLDQILAAV